MEGFLKFITSNCAEAAELRRRCVFRIVPMSNPDGVIIGNYRASFSGNDLNRTFNAPDYRLHPTVNAIKKMVEKTIEEANENLTNDDGAILSGLPKDKDLWDHVDPITTFIDIHGHSRKKNAFFYGPYFPLHDERYIWLRVLPKLFSDRTHMFRYWSCKFRISKSKEKAARAVVARELKVMNTFTLETSFHGFLTSDRKNVEFNADHWAELGVTFGKTLLDYFLLLDSEDK
jgi:hypothetical protein